MPVHDWSRVQAGIFHHFRHSWIEEIKRALNNDLLPGDYYALAEQHTDVIPDVLAWERPRNEGESDPQFGRLVFDAPCVRLTGETDTAFYRRKQSTVAVRHVSGDRIVAMVEIVSPGNKASRNAVRSFMEKAGELLDRGIHLLILDVHPPGPRDPHGMPALIWEEVAGQDDASANGKPLTLAAYETGLSLRTYVECMAVGDVLPDMPLFLKPGGHVAVPLEATYQAAWEAVPQRWRAVLERAGL